MNNPPIILQFDSSPNMRRRAIAEMSRRYSIGGGVVVQLIGGLATALVVGLASVMIWPARNPGVTVLIFGAGFWACLLLWHFAYKSLIRKMMQAIGDTDNERVEFKADQQGIVIASKGARSEMAWSAIDDVSWRGDLIFLIVRATAVALPVSSLPEGMTAQEVLATMTRWKEGLA